MQHRAVCSSIPQGMHPAPAACVYRDITVCVQPLTRSAYPSTCALARYPWDPHLDLTLICIVLTYARARKRWT